MVMHPCSANNREPGTLLVDPLESRKVANGRSSAREKLLDRVARSAQQYLEPRMMAEGAEVAHATCGKTTEQATTVAWGI